MNHLVSQCGLAALSVGLDAEIVIREEEDAREWARDA